MELQHFSHKHPLVLINEVPKGGDEVVCYGCQKPITSSAYSCIKCNYFFLHKKCGELPQGIKPPTHPKHPLTLIRRPYRNFSSGCDICGHEIGKNCFTYHCSECEVHTHIWCIQLPEREVVENKLHNHPLTFMQKPASFFCDACGTEGEDLSYRCNSNACQFWIHDSCASSLSTIKRNDHYHPLDIAYVFPYSQRKFIHFCYICTKVVLQTYWVYYCASCRYFAHLKCATTSEEPLMLSDANNDTMSEDQNLDSTLMHLPMPENWMVPMSQLVMENSFGDEKGMIKCHDCQDYTLIYYEIECNNEMKNRGKLCDVCSRPICFPFYHCGQCNFIVHKRCSQLPQKINHPYHPEHSSLTLVGSHRTFKFFRCGCCLLYGNGFYYAGFHLRLGVCCASGLPSAIKHEAHKHPLIQSQVSNTSHPCGACGVKISPGTKYGCNTCNFHLHIYCAMLPGTFRHEWDRHSLSLTYPPFDHPDEFFCEYCEQQFHPTTWLYHCHKCDQSFHTRCIRLINDWSNAEFGCAIEFKDHSHNLTFVRKGKRSLSPCDHCGKKIKKYFPVFECTSCSFQVCVNCANGSARRIRFADEE